MAKGKAKGLPFFFDTWFSHTDHLSDSAYRAYHRLIGFMWEHGENQSEISENPAMLTRAMKIRGRELQNAMDEIMPDEGGLLLREGNKLINKRLREEHAKFVRRSEKAKHANDVKYGRSPEDTPRTPKRKIEDSRDSDSESDSPSDSHRNDLDPVRGNIDNIVSAIEFKGERSGLTTTLELIAKTTRDDSFKTAPKWRNRITYILGHDGGAGDIDDILHVAAKMDNPAAYVSKRFCELESYLKAEDQRMKDAHNA